MERLIETIANLHKELGALRSDVQILTKKVDNIADNITVKSQSEMPHMSESIDHSVNYGRELSQKEQEYIKSLYHNDVVEKSVEQKIVAEETAERSASAPSVPVKIHEKNIIENFFIWFAKDWPMKVGGVFVIAAIGWFVTYAAKVGWLSETARVVLGYVFAVACIAFGSLRAEKERVQGNLFLIIGIAAMLVSTLASIYFDIIIPVVGLFVMLVSVGFVTLVSLKQKSISLTSSMIFFGAIIPLFFFAGVEINVIFMYLFVLTFGTLWVVVYTGWRGLTTLMLFVMGFYSVGYIVGAYGAEIETLINIVFAFLFTGLFYIANVSAIMRSQKVHTYDLSTALGTGILFLVWILNFSPPELEIFLLLIGTLLFATASYLIFARSGHREPAVLYGGVSAVLFVVITARLFDGPILTTAYLAEAAVAVILMLYFSEQKMTNNKITLSILLYFVPFLLSLGAVARLFDYLLYENSTILDMMPNLFVVFVVSITAFSVAIAIMRLTDFEEKENMIFFRIFAYAGAIYGLLLIWFITHLFMGNYDLATFTSLVIYTILGVLFYILGVQEDYQPYKFVGGLLFGVVVLRVVFVEFWEMDSVMRIITAFVLGALLISTAFIRTKKKN